MKKLVIGLVAACAALCAVALAGCGSAASASGDDGGITVSASSSTQVVPDKARITVAVSTQAATAEECQQANAQDVNAVIDALLAAGVLEENIQTEWANLNPIQDYSVLSAPDEAPVAADVLPADAGFDTAATSDTVDADADSSAEVAVDDPETVKDTFAPDDPDMAVSSANTAGAGVSAIVGYEMYTSLSVDGISIDAVGAISAAAVAAGATDVNGIQYYASSYDEAYEAALGEAIEAARQKAQSIAEMSDVRLGAIVAVTEGYQDTGYRYANSMEFDVAEDAAGAAAKTMPGQVDITAQVTVRFAIA